MPKTVNSVGPCPYRTTCVEYRYDIPNIEERFDFQIGENGQVDIISLGEFDLCKEVNSHAGEVGLINVLRLAQGRGLDESIFAKTETGLMVDVSNIETVDDLIQAQKANTAKLEEIAASAGISVDQLLEIVKSGDFSALTPKEDTSEEGGAE